MRSDHLRLRLIILECHRIQTSPDHDRADREPELKKQSFGPVLRILAETAKEAAISQMTVLDGRQYVAASSQTRGQFALSTVRGDNIRATTGPPRLRAQKRGTNLVSGDCPRL